MRALGILLLVVGCMADVDGSEGRTDKPEQGSGMESGGGTAITISQYTDWLARIYCDQSFQCMSSFPPDLGYTFESQWGATLPECTSRLVMGWNPPLIETEIAKGRIMYDGEAAVSCLEGVTTVACDQYWTRGIDWAESCYHVMVGTVPVGGLCETSYSCTSSNCDVMMHMCI
jgi:hypothetical protein